MMHINIHSTVQPAIQVEVAKSVVTTNRLIVTEENYKRLCFQVKHREGAAIAAF